jgi:ribonucleoside-diphosphate reductase alpha chain
MLDEGEHGSEETVPSAPSAETVAKAAELPRYEGASVPIDHDAPMCFECGIKMKRAGACHVCESCGTTSGCS